MENNKVKNEARLNQLKTLCEAEKLDAENGEILFEPLGIAALFDGDEEVA
jgi:hypothetical protein